MTKWPMFLPSWRPAEIQNPYAAHPAGILTGRLKGLGTAWWNFITVNTQNQEEDDQTLNRDIIWFNSNMFNDAWWMIQLYPSMLMVHNLVLYVLPMFCRCFSHQSCRFVFGFLQLGWFGRPQRLGVCKETGHLCRCGNLPPGRRKISDVLTSKPPRKEWHWFGDWIGLYGVVCRIFGIYRTIYTCVCVYTYIILLYIYICVCTHVRKLLQDLEGI